MRKNISHIFLFCLLVTRLSGQTMEVILNERIPDQKFEKSEVAVPCFRLVHDSIEHILPSSNAKSQVFKVKLAKMDACLDTAYTYIFFNGIENNPLKGSIPVLIGNYNQALPMKLWIDMNCNFDFSDDGDPIELKKNFKYVDLILSNSKLTDGLYVTRWSKFNFKNNSSYYFMLDKYFKNLYPNRKFLGPNYCFREQQLKTIARRIKIGQDSMSIGLYDGNGNGLYTDVEEDEILIGDFNCSQLSTLPEDGAIEFTESKSYTFSRRGIKYELSNIDAAGKSCTIKILDEKVAIGPEVGTKLKFKFKNHKDKFVKTRKYRCKKVVIYIFDWNNPELGNDTVALNEISKNYGKKVKIIMLNYGKQPGLIKNYVQFAKPKYDLGISSAEINRLCKVEKMPTTIFLKKRRKVYLPSTTPTQILTLLKENKL
ncbi:MAG: hypothetical protein HYZ42_01895 [Bacteroidetes bacterium]|nr:hypothetical protein [Bacteroidota bacterium]